MEGDFFIDRKEQKRLISMIKGIKFVHLHIHEHYYQDNREKRLSLEKVKTIYPQFKQIVEVSKRKTKVGYKYAFLYKIGKRNYYKLVLLLDEKPKKLLTAYPCGKNVMWKLLKGYNLRF